METAPTTCKSYRFYVEGLRMYATVNGYSEKEAHDKLWNRLSDAAQNQVVQMEMIEVSDFVE